MEKIELSKNNNGKKFQAGFSLIELLVTISIIFLVSGLVFFNHSQFNNNVLIENLAYEVSLIIRQAQSYSIQAKETEAGTFRKGYGVYFNVKSDHFLIFSDDNQDLVYNAEDDTIVDILKMANGNKIADLCVDGVHGMNELNISFIRPNPAAIIKVNSDDDYSSAEIYLESPKGFRKKIYINKVGQIAVQPVTE